MWKVKNNRNKIILDEYEKIIIDFFELIIELSKDIRKNDNLEKKDFIEDEFNKKTYLSNRLLKRNINKKKKIKELVVNLIKMDSSLLEEQFQIYKIQNREISKKNYNIKPEKHPKELKIIFKDYFYNDFFGKEWIWKEILKKQFNRNIFKKNFQEENNLFVCPYCDIDTLTSKRNSYIEHFLPKAKFPFIACNTFNLLISCSACNVDTGKGANIKNPIVTQYNMEIGDKIKFEIKGKNILIKKNPNQAIENYIELLKLRARYKNVQENIIKELKTNYKIMKKIGLKDKSIFIEFIYERGRERGFYFVQKEIFKDFDDYLNNIGID